MNAYLQAAWRLMRRWPGPWLLAASACGWLVLILRVTVAAHLDPMMPSSMAMHHAGAHLQHHTYVDWVAMVLAMSPLVLVGEIAWLWRINLPRNRRIAITVFCMGYGTPWLAVGVVWVVFLAGLNLQGPALLLAFAALLLWHSTPTRQRLLNACHRCPALRAFGTRMMFDTAAFGVRAGVICCLICAPAMLTVMALPAYHLAAMAAITVVLTIERYLAPRRPAWRLPWSWIDRAPRWHSLPIATAPAPPSS